MFFIGIDVGKFNHCCSVINSDGECLLDHGFEVGLINPISTDAKRKEKIRKTKNDKKDTLTICAVLQSREFTHMTRNKLSLREGKLLTRYHHDLTRSLNQAKNKLQKCIDIVFPEFNTVFATKYSNTYMAVLKECGSAKAVRDTHLTHLKKIISDASNGKINSHYPSLLKESAKTSIGEDNAVITLEIKQLVASIELLIEQLDAVDKKIEELYEFHRSDAKDLLRKGLKYPARQIRSLAKIGVFSEQELYKFIIGKISTKEKILEEPLNKFKRDLVKEIFGEEILKMIEE